MYNKINNKMDNIYEVIEIIHKIYQILKKNILYINSRLFESLLLGDLQLKYKLNTKINDTLNFMWYEIYRKNRKNKKNKISSNEVNTDKLELLERMCNSMILYMRQIMKC